MQKIARSVNDHGRVIGEDHHRARLSDHDVWLIQELVEQGVSQVEVAEKFEISRASVSYYVNGKRRGHLAVGQRVEFT